MIPCKVCDGKAKFDTFKELNDHSIAVHGMPMPDALVDPAPASINLAWKAEILAVSESELYMINRALHVAAAVYTADAIVLSRTAKDDEAALACFTSAREMRALLDKLENR